nr:MAG TPA: hypothetical protein [Caudoviricetes sp.]
MSGSHTLLNFKGSFGSLFHLRAYLRTEAAASNQPTQPGG